MFWLEKCPRCSGDLYSSGDVYGNFIYCLQCSHYLTEPEEARLKSVSSKKAKARQGSNSRQRGTTASPPVVHIKIPTTAAA